MSLRSRLLCLVALAMLGPAILVALRFVDERTTVIDQALAKLADTAALVAEDLADKIQGTEQLHYGLARAVDLDTRDRDSCSRFLSEVREAHPQYTGILTIDPDGRLFCDSLRTGRNLDLRDRRYFIDAQTAMKGVTLQPAFGRLTGQAVLQIAHPARTAGGDLKFVLLASLNLTKFMEGHQRRLPETDLVLLDKDGTVLVWTRGGPLRVRAGESLAGSELMTFAAADATARVAGIGGGAEARFWAVAERSRLDPGLYVMAGVARSQLVAEANRRLVQDLAILAAVSAVLFAAAWLLAEISIRRQVARIADMATRLGQGDLTARIAPPFPSGELRRLMEVLNGAAESLQRQRAAIEELDQKLYQSQKMEAVGQLTGGVAHDFNNLLTVILGNAEMLGERIDDGELRELVEMTMSAAERAAELTSRLLAFSRRQVLQPRRIDLDRQVGGMKGLLRRTLTENIELEIVPGAGLWIVEADPGQVEVAILNLAINARDAMPDGGKLTISTANATLAEADGGPGEEVKAGDYVSVAVSDTGTGMAPDVVARVFEPFFTTKDVGKGSGLGLSMVYGFVKQSGGHVRIDSAPGRGTTVTLYLPRAADAAEAAAAQAATSRTAAGGKEHILVVEDDARVRRQVTAALSGLGYRVTEVDSGPPALRALRRLPDIDLLFTDVVMPGGMNGRQLAEEARKLRPGLPILFTSGYSEDVIMDHGRLDAGIELLDKPYRRHELAAKIRKVLDARA